MKIDMLGGARCSRWTLALAAPSGAISTEANGIDPQGDVVRRYVTPDGHTHAGIANLRDRRGAEASGSAGPIVRYRAVDEL